MVKVEPHVVDAAASSNLMFVGECVLSDACIDIDESVSEPNGFDILASPTESLCEDAAECATDAIDSYKVEVHGVSAHVCLDETDDSDTGGCMQ